MKYKPFIHTVRNQVKAIKKKDTKENKACNTK